MIDEFKSLEELYDRVKPALSTKVFESHEFGFEVSEIDIWKYLVETRWKKAHKLTLSDIVNDILLKELSKGYPEYRKKNII